MKGTDIIPHHSFLFHLFIVFMILVINSAENIIMMVTINNNAGQPKTIIAVINTISSASVKNCVKNISSPVDMFIYQIA